MKRILFLLFIIYLSVGCKDKNLTPKETVDQYYAARDASNFKEMKSCISDSITIIEGDYIMPYSRDSYHTEFKWDSIFGTAYKIVELVEDKDKIIATVAASSVRYDFLKNNPLTCQYKISFTSNMISKIEMMDCIDVDWKIWQEERESLVNWTKDNHADLDGFIHDMTMEGAIKYIKAIELYEKNK